MEKESRGLGGKRCVRRNISITSELESKLKRLSIACDLPASTVATIILETGLNSENLINWLQDKYNKKKEWRTTPIIQNTEQGKKVILL